MKEKHLWRILKEIKKFNVIKIRKRQSVVVETPEWYIYLKIYYFHFLIWFFSIIIFL